MGTFRKHQHGMAFTWWYTKLRWLVMVETIRIVECAAVSQIPSVSLRMSAMSLNAACNM